MAYKPGAERQGGLMAYNQAMKKLAHTTISIAVIAAAALVAAASLLACKAQPVERQPRKEVIPVQRQLVCIGDSITYGYGLEHPEADAWPALLGEQLGDAWQVENLGVSGSTLCDEGAFPYRSTGNIERAKEVDPNVAIIMLGTNDAYMPGWDSDAYCNELEALVDELTDASSRSVRIVLMAPPHTFYVGGSTYGQRAAESGVGEVLRDDVKAVADRKGLQFIDLYEFTEDHAEWFSDELHPNTEGHRAIADHIHDELASW